MDSVVSFLSAAGVGGIIGSIVTSFLQSWLSRRAALDERRFREKKEACLNILLAIKELEIKATLQAEKNFLYWIAVCDLVASPEVRSNIRRLSETNPLGDGSTHHGRQEVMANIIAAMRADLGIAVPDRD